MSDIDTAVVVDGLKVLDLKRPIREADILLRCTISRFVPLTESRQRSDKAHAASSSNSAFASFRSNVSNPSVNQPYTGASSSRACCSLP